MKLTTLLLTFGLTAGMASAATLQLSDFFNASRASNSLGTPTDGMTWGILVDTLGNGFDSGAYTTTAVDQSLASNDFFGGTDDFLFIAANATLTTPSGPGTMTQVVANFDEDAAVVGGLVYTLIWFESDTAAGANFGISAATDNLPGANGDLVNPTAFFGDNGSASLTMVPEPSSAALIGLGGLALILRRRK